jgi:hypothetical protein
MFQTILDGFKKVVPILVFVILLALVVGIVFTFQQLVKLGNSEVSANAFTLPLLAIGGVILLILVLTIVAAIFEFLDLANKNQAMGLPEGSIRAVIALSLIVLFAILAVYFTKAFLAAFLARRSTRLKIYRILSARSSCMIIPR